MILLGHILGFSHSPDDCTTMEIDRAIYSQTQSLAIQEIIKHFLESCACAFATHYN